MPRLNFWKLCAGGLSCFSAIDSKGHCAVSVPTSFRGRVGGFLPRCGQFDVELYRDEAGSAQACSEHLGCAANVTRCEEPTRLRRVCFGTTGPERNDDENTGRRRISREFGRRLRADTDRPATRKFGPAKHATVASSHSNPSASDPRPLGLLQKSGTTLSLGPARSRAPAAGADERKAPASPKGRRLEQNCSFERCSV